MQRKFFLYVLLLALGVFGLYRMFFYEEYMGKKYPSISNLCVDFAQSYLKTVPRSDMSIDVESDLYNLCLVDLNPESLKNFKLNNLVKYQK